MPTATLPVLVNVLIAGMFAASFLTISQLNPEFRHIRWFAVSYAAGMLTPLAEFLLPVSPVQAPIIMMSYAGIFIGIVLMSPALSLLYDRRPAWKIVMAVIVAGLLVRLAIWNGPRGVFWYEMSYQAPFAIASLLCVATFVKHGRKTWFDRIAMVLFAIIALHFLVKPFLAVRLGPGSTATDYIKTNYALISQSSSGVLLIAAGLLVLINALQVVVLRDRVRATTDPLTGLANRRALHSAFERMMRKDAAAPLFITLFDIDHFKAINDSWGHDEGDAVISGFAACLRERCPPGGLAARIGGEEFVLLFSAADLEAARRVCEQSRTSLTGQSFFHARHVTASAGLTQVVSGEDLGMALARADKGLYRAKQQGRDQHVFEAADGDAPRVVAARLR